MSQKVVASFIYRVYQVGKAAGPAGRDGALVYLYLGVETVTPQSFGHP